MSRYQRLSKEITKIDVEIEKTSQALTEVQARVDSAQGRLDALWESLKAKLMQDDKTSVKDVEEAIDEAKGEATRDKALAEGLREKLPALEQQREALVSERNEIIVENAGKWLSKEIAAYEAHRESLLQSVRRLFAVSHVLHDASDQGRELSRTMLGPAITRLPLLKIPSIKAFDGTMYVEDQRRDFSLVASKQERETAINEITGG